MDWHDFSYSFLDYKIKNKRGYGVIYEKELNQGGKTVKEILLIGDTLKGNTFIDALTDLGSFKIRRANSPLKALKLLKKNSPDYLMCTGKIRETIDGKYFVELESWSQLLLLGQIRS